MTPIGGRDLFEAVAGILWEDWDPIGAAVPADEYDSYVPAVVRILQSGAGREAVIDHLKCTAREAMDCVVSDAQLEAAADKLVALVS